MMEREGFVQLAIPYELGVYDSVFYELRMEYVKSNDGKLSGVERQLEALQMILKNQQNSQSAYDSICSHARIMTETACAALLSLFPELKAKILVLLEDPSSSTYAQIQNFGTFFHEKQTTDPYLFANGKKFVQYLTMLRQIGNFSAHINTADVNVFDALTAISSSIQVAILLLGFSAKLNPFASQFSLSPMEIAYHQPSQHQLFQQPTLFQQTSLFPQPAQLSLPSQPQQSQQQPIQHLLSQQPMQGQLSFLPQHLQFAQSPVVPVQKLPQPQQPPQQPQQPQQSPISYQQQKFIQQPYLAVLTRPAPPQQPPQQPQQPPQQPHKDAKENGMNGMTVPSHMTTTTTTTTTTTALTPQKYETSHLWVRNVDIAIDKNALAARFQAHVPKDLIQNIYINTPEIDNPCYYTAYINFKTVEAATRAKNALDGVVLGARKVSIQFNECPSLLKKGKMCISCKILSESKGKVVWSKYWVNSTTKK